MQREIYADILFVINYVINMLLLACLNKCTGRHPRHRRLVGAALLGAAASLGIFLPFQSFFSSIFARLLLSGAMIRVLYRWAGLRTFLRECFLLFAISFFFAGVMLGLWLTLRPAGMVYYNGIVYFDISPASLIACTAAAYLALGLWQRFSRAGRLGQKTYDVTLYYGGRHTMVTALADTGNQLYEPFSDTPVMVCEQGVAAALLPGEVCAAILAGNYSAAQQLGTPLRMVPYRSVGKEGLLPAFRVDCARLVRGKELWKVETLYVAIAGKRLQGNGYNAVLNPDLVGAVRAQPLRETNAEECKQNAK